MARKMDQGEVARRQLALFFLIDTSGSMASDKIGAVNAAMREMIPELQKLADEEDNAESDIEIAVLEFNTSAEWKTKGKPVPVRSFVWNELGVTGNTNLGMACEMLDAELRRGKFLREHYLFAPVLILMSDGMPNKGYEAGLAKLKQNEYFANKDHKGNFKEKSIKVACAIGNDADKEVLAQFTENKELVYEVHTITALKNWIKFIAVASSVASLHDDGIAGMAEKLEEFKKEEDRVTTTSSKDF